MTKNYIISNLLYAFTALILLMFLLTGTGYFSSQTYKTITLDSNPFLPMEVIEARRADDQLEFNVGITQTEQCEFNTENKSFFKFITKNNVYASDIFIHGKQLTNRTPFSLGDKINISGVTTTIPKEVLNENNVIVQVIVRCTKNDGVSRSFILGPSFKISPNDGDLEVIDKN